MSKIFARLTFTILPLVWLTVVGPSVFDLSVSGRPPAASEGVGPPRLKTKTKCRNRRKQPDDDIEDVMLRDGVIYFVKATFIVFVTVATLATVSPTSPPSPSARSSASQAPFPPPRR